MPDAEAGGDEGLVHEQLQEGRERRRVALTFCAMKSFLLFFNLKSLIDARRLLTEPVEPEGCLCVQG